MYYRYLGFASLVKGGSIQPHWMMDGSSFWYAEDSPENTTIWKVDPSKNSKTSLFDSNRLRRALARCLGHEPNGSGLPFFEFSFVDGERAARFNVESRDFTIQLDSYSIYPLNSFSTSRQSAGPSPPRGGTAQVPSPDGRWVASVQDHNIFLYSNLGDLSEQITVDGIKDYEWEVTGAVWSPDSSRVAVRKVDSRGMNSIPIVHWLKAEEEIEWVRYTKAGGPMGQAELFILDRLGKREVRLDTGQNSDHYFFILGWLPDGSELFFLKMDRETKRLELRAANPATGATRVVLTETQKTFIGGLEFLNVGWSRVFTMLEDGKRFIWMSERDGWNHLFLYNVDGTLVRRLTEGRFPVLQVVAVDEKAGWIYFTAHAEERLYDTHLYRVNFDGREFKRLTDTIGHHEIDFAPSKQFFVDTHSSIGRLPAVELRSAAGKLLQRVSEAQIECLKGLKWTQPEGFQVKAADNKAELYGVLYKPYDFDDQKRYPVVDFIYGGPQTTVVPRTFADRRGVRPQALAQLGFITFVVDARGTPERGKEFQDVAYGNIGRNEIPDHVAVLKQLAEERPYMDLRRVGILGHSYGGYFALRAMVMAPDIYHVGISSAPVADLAETPANGIEPYLGLPQNNKEAYEYCANTRLAANLRGKLLLMIGTSDDDVRFSSAMKMVEALVRAGKPYDLIVLPEQPHSLANMDPSVYSYWQERVRAYLEEHLKPEQERQSVPQ
jgi:dipeptidyl aminopeptidase/acylaminoacyl peptidase